MQDQAVWLIDDDIDDQEMVAEVFSELGLKNELKFFETAEAALEALNVAAVAPFIIFSDVNLPKIDGFALRDRMLNHPSKKMHSVPFIFWSTSASEDQITKAYDLSAHGFFIKETNFDEMKSTFTNIVRYWTKSKMPSKRG
jgi:CheY-like chemotaxis protein